MVGNKESVWSNYGITIAIVILTISLLVGSPITLSVYASSQTTKKSDDKTPNDDIKSSVSSTSNKIKSEIIKSSIHRTPGLPKQIDKEKSISHDGKTTGSNTGGNSGCPPGGCPAPGVGGGGAIGGAGGGAGSSSDDGGNVFDFIAPVVKGSDGGSGNHLSPVAASSEGTKTPVPSTSGGGSGATKTTLATAAASSANSPPTVESFTLITKESQPIMIMLKGSDPDGKDTLTFSILSPPVSGTLGIIAGAGITYTPGPDLVHRVDSFKYRATDSVGLSSNLGTVSIKVIGP